MKKNTAFIYISIFFVVLTIVFVVVGRNFSKTSIEVGDLDSNVMRKSPRPHSEPSSTRKNRATERSSHGKVKLNEDFNPALYRTVDYKHGENISGDDQSRAYIGIPSTSQRVMLTPNQLGEYPLQPADMKETLAVRLVFKDIAPGTPVAVSILDGGSFPSNETSSRLLEIQKWGGVSFKYTTSANPGHHRLRVQPRGHPIKILDFYAGVNAAAL